VIGTVLEKYEILEKVGEGGMATVYRGRHTTLDRVVAIKVLHPHLSSSEKNRTRFEREAHAIESLRHPNILRIFDYSGPKSEQCFIVTEFIQGPTLRALLDEVGVMMPEPAALLARQLCQALQIAHAQGIVHRDIKPENVMIDRSGAVKLMDFGIARLMDDLHVTMTGALVGSPAYMSPEQATSGTVDPRSDLFSLGTVFYRMLTGTLPFRGSNPSVVLKNIIDGVYDDPLERVPSLSPVMAAITCRLLARDPADRYASAAEVLTELDAFLRSVKIDPESPGEWALTKYLEAPEAYEEKLRPYLVLALVERGKAEVARGETARALKTFNRVLALDEDNREVVDIIEGLRPPLRGPDKRTSPWLWAAPLVAVVATLLALAWTTEGFQSWGGAAGEGLVRMAPVPMLAVPYPEEWKPEPAPQPSPEEAAEGAPPASALVPVALAARSPLDRARARPEPAGEAGLRLPAVAMEGTPREAVPEPATPEAVALAPAEELIPPGEGEVKIVPTQFHFRPVLIDDGRKHEKPTWFTLPSGKHTVTLPETDFALADSITIVVRPGDRKSIDVDPRWKSSRVVLEGFPPDVIVRVDGVDRGRTRSIELNSNKTFRFEFILDGGVEFTRELTRGTGLGVLHPGDSFTIEWPKSAGGSPTASP
jgi:serine/threonine-protein kinase